jgi:predicted  nucleic acid-binding Zn-ribbon protein
MQTDVENLIALQAADKEIRRLKDEIAALPKRVAAIEERLAGTKAALEKAKADVKADESSRRKFESTIQDLQGKISKYRDQSLAVKTNDQYKALLHEIQFAEQDIRGNEDKILEVMVNTELREKAVKAAEAELKAETAEIELEKNIARERTATDEKELAEWNAKRDTARTGVNPDMLQHYDRVAKHRGSGLAEVRDQKCMGCQVLLRPQTYNDVRASQRTVVCDSCQRILYYNPAHDTQMTAAVATASKRRRAHPKFDASQAWYYQPTFGEQGEVYLNYINASGSSTRRVYDVNTGRKVGDTLTREGEYRLGFPEDLNGTTRLNGNWSEDEIEGWDNEMPMVVLDALQRDLDLAKAEANAPRTRPETVSVQHPAAS